MRIDEALALARAQGVARLDAQLLLSHLLAQSRSWLLAHDEQSLAADQAASYRAMLERRAGGEPLAYVTAACEFRGLRLQLTPDVLVPRPETELLVEWALECLDTAAGTSPSVVDLGTGSGAVALAIQHARPQAQVCASDTSLAALAVARANGLRLQLPVHWLAGDWWAPMAGRRYALAVSNPPYIAGDDLHLQALRHEPRAALTPEGDGLDALRHIVAGAPAHLLPGAWLLLEHGHDQADAVQQMLLGQGFKAAQTRMDLSGLPRCTGATWYGAN